MSIIEQIEAHEKEVLAGIVPANLQFCLFCNSPSESIKRYEGRYRVFYIVKESYVDRKESCLGRWKCSICKKTFTYYPDYTIPYKRYVIENIVEFSSKYLSNDNTSYHNVVNCEGTQIIYKGTEATTWREFSGTSVWRWLQYFSELRKLVQKGLRLIREKSPTCAIFRAVYPIIKRKFKTTARKEQLEKSMELLDVAKIFKKYFETTIFPNFAIEYW
ncbi:MAG: DUF6431 domain-containing protein [Planctomycetota bacterium]|jgi:hypothetical protein